MAINDYDKSSLSGENIPKDLWEEQIDKWFSEELTLIEDQKKLNNEFLNTLKDLKPYLEVYNFNTDFEYDRSGTVELKKFLKAHENDRDLKVILDLKRGESGTTILHEVANFNIMAVSLLLDARTNPNIQDKEGKIPLHHVAEDYCIEAVRALLDKGNIDVNVQDKYGKTPLHYASNNDGSHECDESIGYLLEQGAKVDIQDNQGNTPLHYAAEHGYVDGMELLVEKNQGINLINKDKNTALHLALYNKDVRIAECILDNKDRDVDVNIKNKKGWTPLLLAALLNSTQVMHRILKRGANIKYTDSEGNSALHYAACNDHTGDNLKTTKYDHLAPDNDPLNSNSNDYSEDIAIKSVNELITAGIDINIRNKNGSTPLFFAVENMKPEVVKQLLRQEADVGTKNKNGYTALHYAIKIRSLRMLKILLPHEIDSDGIENDEEVDSKKAKELLSQAIDNRGNTLLHHAIKLGCSREILDFLVENAVDINAKNKNGVAPIHIAAKYGHEHLMDFFIENKADINVQCGNFTESEIKVTEGKFINIQDGSSDESSVIDIKNDAEYKKATPMSIAASNSHENATGKLLSQGVKPSIHNDKGWTPIYIAIRKACDKNCKEEEREKAYQVIEKLAVFSDIKSFRSKGVIDTIITKTKGILTSTTQEPFLIQAANGDKRIRDILENALKSRKNNKPPTAPVDQYAPSAPPLDDSFYNELGSYIEEIPDLYPDLTQEFNKELEKSTIAGIKSPEQESIEEIPDNKLDKFSDGMAKNIIELNKVVNEKLKLGIKIKHGFVDLVIAEIEQLNGVKENPEIASDIICKLVSKGADIGKYRKMNEELEVLLEDHKANIQKAYFEFNELTKDLHNVATKAARAGKVSIVEIDNTTFYLEYLPNSIVDTAKVIDGARTLGLNQGNIALGGNIIKIGKSEVEIETRDNIRNYTNLSSNGNIILTFNTNLGELQVKLRHNMQNNEDVIEVEVCDQEKFKQLVDSQEEIGKNCLLGGFTVCDAIKKGYFTRSEKCQSSEIIQDMSQDTEEKIDSITKGNGNTNANWQSILETRRTDSCGRGI